MFQEQHTHNLRMALDEALRYNDDIARQVDKLETEISSDFACGLWRLSQMQTVHIRKTGCDRYGLSVWTQGYRIRALSLQRIGRYLHVIDENNTPCGSVYYFPENDALLIESLGLCTSIEKSDV